MDASRVTRWVAGERPRPPTGEILAELLSEHAGTPITLDDLGLAPPNAQQHVPADHGLDVPWDPTGLLRLLEDWPTYMLSRRDFLTISGAAVTTPAWRSFETPAPILAAAAHADRAPVGEPLLQLIADIAARAQQLDDQHGAAGAVFVAEQFGCVARLLRRSSYDPTTGRTLASALAQLAQTAGFMAYDSHHDGQAQRWYITGLHAAHAADDRPLTASILALMSNQAITLGKISDALQLAAASREAAAHAPSPVQALITARAGLAHAAAGDITAVRHAREHTLELLSRADRDNQPPPRWASYVTRTELDAIAGRGLVTLATHIPHRSKTLLADAEKLLHDRAHTDQTSPPQRSALRHGAWLGLAHMRAGNLDQAIDTTRVSIGRIDTVSSPRIIGLLNQLRTILAAHASRSPAVRDVIADLDNHLPTPPNNL